MRYDLTLLLLAIVDVAVVEDETPVPAVLLIAPTAASVIPCPLLARNTVSPAGCLVVASVVEVLPCPLGCAVVVVDVSDEDEADTGFSMLAKVSINKRFSSLNCSSPLSV